MWAMTHRTHPLSHRDAKHTHDPYAAIGACDEGAEPGSEAEGGQQAHDVAGDALDGAEDGQTWHTRGER